MLLKFGTIERYLRKSGYQEVPQMLTIFPDSKILSAVSRGGNSSAFSKMALRLQVKPNMSIIPITDQVRRRRLPARPLLMSCTFIKPFKLSNSNQLGIPSAFNIANGVIAARAVSYTHLTLPTNREV